MYLAVGLRPVTVALNFYSGIPYVPLAIMLDAENALGIEWFYDRKPWASFPMTAAELRVF